MQLDAVFYPRTAFACKFFCVSELLFISVKKLALVESRVVGLYDQAQAISLGIFCIQYTVIIFNLLFSSTYAPCVRVLHVT